MENTTQNDSASYPGHVAKSHLSPDELAIIQAQNSRLVPQYQAAQLEKHAKKHWDLFYKRNEARFFKDRHWTTREFEELLGLGRAAAGSSSRSAQCLLEVGCGVGNLIYPLIESGDAVFRRIYACDLSPRAIEFVKSHKLYTPEQVVAFQADVTESDCFEPIDNPIDLATLVFVLSTIHPDKFKNVLGNLFQVMSADGVVLFRDYGRYDMAQLRFKPGHKISENFYMRQDGTRSYYFTTEEVQALFESVGFRTIDCAYVQRRTVNVKEKIDVPRIFVQGKFAKT